MLHKIRILLNTPVPELRESRQFRKWGLWILFGLSILSAGVWLIARSVSIERGLSGSYYDNVEWAGLPVVTVRDTSIDLWRVARGLPSHNYSIQWTGMIFVPEPGRYQFTITSDGQTVLLLNNNLLIDSNADSDLQEQTASVPLKKGFYPIMVRYMQKGEGTALSVYWTRPEKEQTRLSEEFLFPKEPKRTMFFIERTLIFASTATGLLWFCYVIAVLLIFLSSRHVYKRIFCCFDKHFVVLLLFVCVINIPYFSSVFNFVPAHDTMGHILNFSVFYNEYVLHDQIPLWMPFHLYGVSSDFQLFNTISPTLYFIAWVGKLLSVLDSLLLYKFAMLIEQLALLVGMYLLSKRLFSYRTTALFVCIGSIAVGGFWAIDVTLNFRLYYLMPFVLLSILKFYDTGNFKFLPIAGIITLISLIGNVFYFAPLFLLLYGVFTVVLFFPKIRNLSSHIKTKTLFSPSSLCFFLTCFSMAIIFLYYAIHSLDYIMLYSPARDRITGEVPLSIFLTFGHSIDITKLLEIIYAVPASVDQTFYLGFIALTFFVYALIKSYHVHLLRSILVTAFMYFVFSLSYITFVAPLAYLVVPFMNVFRHIGLIRSPVILLMLLVSGFGVESYLNSFYRDSSKRGVIIGIGVSILALVLFIDIFAFKGTLPYTTYLQIYIQDPPDNQFHYFTCFVLATFLYLVHQTSKLKSGNIRLILIACLVLEVTSYHYFLFHISPIMLNEPDPEVYMTAEVYNRRIDLLKSSLNVQPYHFQNTRITDEQVSLRIDQTVPLINQYMLAKYSNLFSAGYVDPCFQSFRFEYLPLGIDRFIRARLGIPLDKPLSKRKLSPNELSEDQGFMRAIGCSTPKLFLTSQVHIANNLSEAASMIKNSQELDKVPVIFSETSEDIQQTIHQTAPLPKSAGTAGVTRFTANSLYVQANVASPDGAWLIYLDAYHPRWTATVNGESRPIMTANLAFKALFLDSGSNEVQFTFMGNGLNRFYIQLFFYLGVVSTFLLIGGSWYLLMPTVLKSLFKKMRYRKEQKNV